MTKTIEYGTYIIDLCGAMLEHAQALNPEQVRHIRIIQHHSVQFVTVYLQHESSALPELLTYLGTQAIVPLHIIAKHCDQLLNSTTLPLPPNYREAIAEVLECCYLIHDDLQDMRDNLQAFMNTLNQVG